MNTRIPDLMRPRKPVTKREKWSMSFTKEFVNNHLDKLEEVDKLPRPQFGNATVEWESNGYKWRIAKHVLTEDNKPDLLEYRLVRRTPKITKSVNERTFGDSCWVIRLPNLVECSSKYQRQYAIDNTMNKCNMNHSGFNFSGYSSKHPTNTLPNDI